MWKFVMLSAVASWSLCLSARAEQADARPVSVITEAITLDGKLDEPAWAQAPVVEQFHYKKDVPPPAKTTVRMLADSRFLYLGWRCEDKSPKTLKGDIAVPNGPCWSDDAVEFFIDPGHSFVSLIQIIVTCRGFVFQNGSGVLYEKLGQDFGVEAKIFVGEDFWSVETCVPLDRVGLSLPAYRQGEESRFFMNFARDLRNPAYDTSSGRLDFCASPLGFFERKGFQVFKFAGSAPVLKVSGDETDQFVNTVVANVTLTNSSANDLPLEYTWGKALQFSDRMKVPLVVKAGEAKSVPLSIPEFEAGDYTYRLEVFDKSRRLFARDLRFTLDEAVEIAPMFPCRSLDGGDKEFRLLVAPYVLATGKAFTLEVVVKDRFLPVLSRRFAQAAAEQNVSITDLFSKLSEGRYTVTATLRDGEKPVAANQYAFYKGLTKIDTRDPRVIIKNWGFEETSANRPCNSVNNWRDANPQTPDKAFPSGWDQYKPGEWVGWGDLTRYPRSIYEGQRTMVLKGRAPGAQLHWAGSQFKVNLSSTYSLSIVARGKGRLCCCYYAINDEKKWMHRYFYSRDIQLTDDWTEYQFDPVDFNVQIDYGWDFKPLGEHNRLAAAHPIVWVKEDGLAFIDNVILIEKKN